MKKSAAKKPYIVQRQDQDRVIDGWKNVLTGLGVLGKDKRTGAMIEWRQLNEMDAEHLYAADDTAARCVDLLPDTAFQKGLEVVATDSLPRDEADVVEKYFERLGVYDAVHLAARWARLYGGAGIIPILDDGRKFNEPVDETNIKYIKGFTVLHRWELMFLFLQTDITQPNFGLPRIYNVIPRGGIANPHIIMDWSRIIRFDGSPLPRTLFMRNQYWGDSILRRLYNVIRNFNLANDAAASMMEDFNTGVIKLKDLADILQTEEGAANLRTRIEMMNLARSVLNSIVLDADNESFEQVARPVTGAAEILERINMRLVAATGMPHTKLLGTSPTGGLSGKGENENRDWYDLVSSYRESQIRPVLDKVMKLSLRAKNSPTKGLIPADFTWKFQPLWQMDEQDHAAMRKTMAEADSIYLDRGVIDPSDVARSRFGGDEYSIETTLSADLFAEEEEPERKYEDPKESRITMPPITNDPLLTGRTAMPQTTLQDPAQALWPPITRTIKGIRMSGELPKKGNAMDWEKILDESTTLQTVILLKEKYKSEREARKAAKSFFKGKRVGGVDETSTSYRYRVKEPDAFKEGSFRTISPKEGIALVIGKLK